ncbi:MULTISPECIES: copper resistance protein NlpE N-terminal domain-containing protein [Psychrobacter]|jgi:uncharacterized lipoprotein NlpE involved in copper resistance|uniref:Copper resistance protein NlpE N-terminal domain-containing protein n=2 Tax=Psychrobacter namhaensis TaxID=292734 RepID=A0ABW8L835_9GAMM|nr:MULTISPECIES: copper resistance protein NlpE N-terminal domain-containing protein [Psychrobacter]
MTMIYFAPIRSIPLTVIRRVGCSLLALPICLLLVGCDSASSNANKGVATTFAPVSNSADSDLQSAAVRLQDSSVGQVESDSDWDTGADGQSLIAAAQSQSSNEAYTQQTLVGSDTPSSSALQATLMGDYGGMVPCNSCANIDVTLNLFADGSVLKTSIYNYPETPRAPLLESGVYRQDNNIITIVYEDKNIETYYIQDNHLVLMDEYKNLDSDYTLSRK